MIDVAGDKITSEVLKRLLLFHDNRYAFCFVVANRR